MLLNLYTAHLGRALHGASLATLRIDYTKIHLMQYADDLVLLDHTKIGLQKALTALSEYNAKNELIANASKSKIAIFGCHPKKKLAKWRLVPLILDCVQSYNYLGAWLSETV